MGLLIFGTGGGGGTGTDLSADTVTPQQVRNPYTFHDAGGNPQTGEIYNWDGTLLSGGSADANKMTVAASTNTRHLKAGCYLARDIELSAMPAGSATMSRENNVITLTKTAGYISAGTATETIPTYAGGTVTPGTSAQTIALTGKYNTGDLVVATDSNLKAEYIRSGVSIFGVAGTYTGQSYPSYTGATSVTPSSVTQTLGTSGTVVGSNITVYGDQNLKSANIRYGYSIFGIQGSCTGSPYTNSITPSSTSMTVACPGFPVMFGFVGNSTTTDKVAAGTGYRGNTGKDMGYVVGRGRGNVLSVSWYDSYFIITISSTNNYTFDTGISYSVWMLYM